MSDAPFVDYGAYEPSTLDDPDREDEDEDEDDHELVGFDDPDDPNAWPEEVKDAEA